MPAAAAEPDAGEDVEDGVHGPLRLPSRPGREPCQMSPPSKRSRPAARDLERYAGLFAQRTKVMKSSAMRDLMAITERPEVISLAGGLPDTSTFPPESYASIMQHGRRRGDARGRCSTGRPRAWPSSRRASPRSWPRRARRSTPTTCSSPPAASRSSTSSARRSSTPATSSSPRRRRTRARSRRSAPTRPTSCRSRWTSDGMRDRRARGDARPRSRREGRRPKFIYTIPNFQNPGGVTMSLDAPPAARRGRRRARAARARGQPVRAAALRGRAAADAALARRRRVRHLPRDVLEDPLARRAPRLGRRAAAGAREDERRQAGRRPVLVVDDAVLRRRVLRAGPLAGLPRLAHAALPAPARRDARRAGRALPGASRRGRTPRAGCSCGRRCPTYLDTTDLLARALQENVAFVPGRAAFLDGRGAVVDAAELLAASATTTSARACGASARSCASRSSCTGR